MATDTVTIEKKLTRTFEAGKARYVITAEIKPAQIAAPHLTVDLLPADPNSKALSIHGSIHERNKAGMWRDAGGGQINKQFRAAFPDDPTVQHICDIWERYHLSDMNAGSREQQAILDDWEAKGYPGSPYTGRYDYSAACEVLFQASKLFVLIPNTTAYRLTFNGETKGMYKSEDEARSAITPHPDGIDHSAEWEITPEPTRYKYGSAWLSNPLSPEIEAEITALMTPPESDKKAAPDVENRGRIAQLGIKMTATRADSNPNMPDRDMDHWKCTFSRTLETPDSPLRAFDVILNGKCIDTVFMKDADKAEDIKRSLVGHDGYDPSIVVRKRQSPRVARMTVYFSKGFGHHGAEPTADEVLECLAQDAAGIENAGDFEDWCREYGYDTDSRTAHRTFKACEHSATRLKGFLGDELYNQLLWNE